MSRLAIGPGVTEDLLCRPPGQRVWWGRTTGKMPYMEYGIGDDRLGGAKMGLLDSNILVKVVDSFQANYKIQLSKISFRVYGQGQRDPAVQTGRRRPAA